MEHDMNALREKFVKMFDKMWEDGLGDCLADEDTDAYDIKNWINRNEDHIYAAAGATRVAIWDEDCDYVVKLQFPLVENGLVLATDEDDDDIYAESEINYNANEVYVYEKAKERGVESCFAWMAYLMDYVKGGMTLPLYVMEYCEIDYDNMSDLSCTYVHDKMRASLDIDDFESEEDMDDYIYENCTDGSDTEGMLEFAESYYSMSIYGKFLAFVNELDMTDLHSGNWGFVDGRLVVTDYAGYGSFLRQIQAFEQWYCQCVYGWSYWSGGIHCSFDEDVHCGGTIKCND